jgi:hypothetical protein
MLPRGPNGAEKVGGLTRPDYGFRCEREVITLWLILCVVVYVA